MGKNNNAKYLVLISIHGLIRSHDLELGRDADTGGQTKYVVDLAKALAERDDVEQVDLITRRIVDVNVSDDYANPTEVLSDKARIVRIDAGPEEYIPKEQLWDHLDSFMDNLTNWLNEQARMPDLVHSHYADAGYVGVRLANLLGVPFIHTGHSLGRDKRKRLLARGLSRDEIEHVYNMERRIDAEEEILANADLVITSTHNEIEEQYGLYNYYDPGRMSVVPPGTDLTLFHPPQGNEETSFAAQLPRFLNDPGKPLILALSRPDERKNILTLIEAFGESRALQQIANLLIVAGSRGDIRDMESGAQSVLTNILLLIDSYDLYGKVAIPKAHSSDEVPAIYRLVTSSRGVFINPALTEPFGLTLLEAAASGLPIVATENGGPVDIIENCKNGELVDPLDKSAIIKALLKFLKNKKNWSQAAKNGIEGVSKHYSWQSHVKTYLEKIDELPGKYQPIPSERPTRAVRYRDRAIFTDLDQNLIGDPKALKHFADVITENRKCVTFGIVTGRRIDSALALMKKHRIPTPDILISSLGTRIHYGQSLTEDDYWADHVDHDWSSQRVRRILGKLPGLKPQLIIEQTPFKVSYYYDPEIAPTIEDIVSLLRQKDISANVMLSFGQFLDIVPSRASKGQALRYAAQRLDIPLEQILVAGGSGADEDMMRGNTLAVVVGNRHHEELSQLVDQERIYFAGQNYAFGILEAIEHYDFFHACKVPEAL
ncbi:MAG: HAD-IIB family hydrolase [Gammaproteobacteria bacterium]|nr:MAG: HAD-IIB family hydrolase [Gammaproteobacteria bacterium]